MSRLHIKLSADAAIPLEKPYFAAENIFSQQKPYNVSLQDKYKSVLDLGLKFNAQDGFVEEADGLLRIGGTVETLYQKDQMWDEIKRIGGEKLHDIQADIKVSNTAYYAKHTVAKGDSLSKIAKEYLGDVMAYKAIFAANTDTLDDPNKIFPGQELVIPFPEGRDAHS